MRTVKYSGTSTFPLTDFAIEGDVLALKICIIILAVDVKSHNLESANPRTSSSLCRHSTQRVTLIFVSGKFVMQRCEIRRSCD